MPYTYSNGNVVKNYYHVISGKSSRLAAFESAIDEKTIDTYALAFNVIEYENTAATSWSALNVANDLTRMNVGIYVNDDASDVDVSVLPTALEATILAGDGLRLIAIEDGVVIKNATYSSILCTEGMEVIAIATKNNPTSADWELYHIDGGSIPGAGNNLYEIGACEANPSMNVEVQTVPTNIGDSILSNETISMTIRDMNATVDNYSFLRTSLHKNKVFIAYIMYSDSVKLCKIVDNVIPIVMPDVADGIVSEITVTSSFTNLDDALTVR